LFCPTRSLAVHSNLTMYGHPRAAKVATKAAREKIYFSIVAINTLTRFLTRSITPSSSARRCKIS
jgi:hypothetical protein